MDLFSEITSAVASLSGTALTCFWISQAIGLVNTGLSIYAGQVNTPKKILVTELVMNLLCALAALLVGGYTGALTNLIAVFVAAFIYRHNHIHGTAPLPLRFLFGSAAAFVLSGLLAIAVASPALQRGEPAAFFGELLWYDALPILACLVFLLSLVCRNATGYRLCMLFTSTSWGVYNAMIGAYTSMLTQILLFVSIVVALVRLDLRRK